MKKIELLLKAITNAENKEFRQLYSKKIKQLMNKLKNDKSFYDKCSESSKLKYYECFGDRQYIYKMKRGFKEVIN